MEESTQTEQIDLETKHQKDEYNQEKKNEPFLMRQVNISPIKQKVIIRCVNYMTENLFALTDDYGQISIYNTSTYELHEFENKYISKKTPSFSVNFYKSYWQNPKTKESIDVACQNFFSNMIIFWNITHFIKTKQLIAFKIILTVYDFIYDSVILPDYSLIAVSHQNQRILCFYAHSNQPQTQFQRKHSKAILSQQFGQSIFSIQYDRKRQLIYAGFINAQIIFYDMRIRQITQIITPQQINKYSFQSILIPRNLSFTDIPEEYINRKMVNNEYDFEYLLVSTDQGLLCINLDQQQSSYCIKGHTNQTRSQVYHKESDSILTISCDKKIGIHSMQQIKEYFQNEKTNTSSIFKETNLKGLCNSISLHNNDVIAVTWQGEIGHYKYENYNLYKSQKLEEFKLLTEQYQTLQKLIQENNYLKSLKQQNLSKLLKEE